MDFDWRTSKPNRRHKTLRKHRPKKLVSAMFPTTRYRAYCFAILLATIVFNSFWEIRDVPVNTGKSKVQEVHIDAAEPIAMHTTDKKLKPERNSSGQSDTVGGWSNQDNMQFNLSDDMIKSALPFDELHRANYSIDASEPASTHKSQKHLRPKIKSSGQSDTVGGWSNQDNMQFDLSENIIKSAVTFDELHRANYSIDASEPVSTHKSQKILSPKIKSSGQSDTVGGLSNQANMQLNLSEDIIESAVLLDESGEPALSSSPPASQASGPSCSRVPENREPSDCIWSASNPKVEFRGSVVVGSPGHSLVDEHRDRPFPVSHKWVVKGQTRYAHMVSLEWFPTARMPWRIFAAWQASQEREGSHDQHIRFAMSYDAGQHWHSSRVVVRGQEAPVWGPVLFADRAIGQMWLFFSRSRKNICTLKARDNWHAPGGEIVAITTLDGGRTWSLPRVLLSAGSSSHSRLTPAPYVTANRPVVLQPAESDVGKGSGGQPTWLLPVWTEARGECGDAMTDAAMLLASCDRGETWGLRGRVERWNSTWFIENTLDVANSQGHLLQMFRTRAGSLFWSRSEDMGHTWTEPAPSQLPNPDSKAHLLRLQDGSLLVAHNNGTERGDRHLLFLSRSWNEGKDWETLLELEAEKGVEFSYPAILQISDASTSPLNGTRVIVAYTTGTLIHDWKARGLPSQLDYKGIKSTLVKIDTPKLRTVKGDATVAKSALRLPLLGGACVGVIRPPLPSPLRSLATAFTVDLDLAFQLRTPQLNTSQEEGLISALAATEIRLITLRGVNHLLSPEDNTPVETTRTLSSSSASSHRSPSLDVIASLSIVLRRRRPQGRRRVMSEEDWSLEEDPSNRVIKTEESSHARDQEGATEKMTGADLMKQAHERRMRGVSEELTSQAEETVAEEDSVEELQPLMGPKIDFDVYLVLRSEGVRTSSLTGLSLTANSQKTPESHSLTLRVTPQAQHHSPACQAKQGMTNRTTKEKRYDLLEDNPWDRSFQLDVLMNGVALMTTSWSVMVPSSLRLGCSSLTSKHDQNALLATNMTALFRSLTVQQGSEACSCVEKF